MRTIIVDDEKGAMEQFEEVCRSIDDVQVIGKFEDPVEALRFAEQNRVDLAVLDIEMPGLNGIELGARLKELYSDVILVYVTGYTKYVLDTIKLKADCCIMKPYEQQDVEEAMERARLLSRRQNKVVQVRMFGRFQVFADQQPVLFRNAKARELFALCVDHRGSVVTLEEAADKLWPEKPYDDRVKRLYRKAVGAVQETLESYGIGYVFSCSRGGCHAVMEHITSDLTEYLEKRDYNEYMLQEPYLYDYSWAEGSFEQDF